MSASTVKNKVFSSSGALTLTFDNVTISQFISNIISLGNLLDGSSVMARVGSFGYTGKPNSRRLYIFPFVRID